MDPCISDEYDDEELDPGLVPVPDIPKSNKEMTFERNRREIRPTSWKKKNTTKDITSSDILQFLIILYYIGV